MSYSYRCWCRAIDTADGASVVIVEGVRKGIAREAMGAVQGVGAVGISAIDGICRTFVVARLDAGKRTEEASGNACCGWEEMSVGISRVLSSVAQPFLLPASAPAHASTMPPVISTMAPLLSSPPPMPAPQSVPSAKT